MCRQALPVGAANSLFTMFIVFWLSNLFSLDMDGCWGVDVG